MSKDTLPPLNYVPLHEFAEANRIDYNKLCAVVRAAIATQTTSPDSKHSTIAEWKAQQAQEVPAPIAWGSGDGFWVRHLDKHLRPDAARFTQPFYAKPQKMSVELIAAMESATAALEECQSYTSCPSWSPSMTEECEAAATKLREFLAAAPKVEPYK